MSNDYQFPPSSPLLDDSSAFVGSSYNEKAFRGRTDYPTPNPSSSLFRSSSPSEESSHKRVTFEVKKSIAINSDFNILNPDANVLRIPLSSTQNKLAVGRSSKACDYFFGSNDRNVSRTHASISYTSEQIVLTCLGRNGLAMRIPKAVHVIETSSKNNFIILENKTGTPLDMGSLGMKQSHKSIRLDANHTEFTLNSQETVTLPRFSNIILEINSHVLLLNPLDLDEELTDEEMPTLIGTSESTEVTFEKLPSVVENSNEMEPVEVESEPVVDISVTQSIATPVKSPLRSLPQAPSKDTSKTEDFKSIDFTPTKPSAFNLTQAKSFDIFEDKVEVEKSIEQTAKTPKSPFKRQSTPLNDTTNLMSVPSTPKRKAQSEEPQKQKKKKVQKSKKLVDTSCLDNVENLEEINNIVINHLSFSRLSSTPASFLQTISVLMSSLSLDQIRTILHNIKCVGVINRLGKDAAGKPLEEEYYYMPENDSDGNRTQLVASIKGTGGLRACRKTHKQYYWKKPAAIKK